MSARNGWIKVGRVLVNPDNLLAVKIAQAGQAAAEVFATARPRDEIAAVEAAVAKRARRAMRQANAEA